MIKIIDNITWKNLNLSITILVTNTHTHICYIYIWKSVNHPFLFHCGQFFFHLFKISKIFTDTQHTLDYHYYSYNERILTVKNLLFILLYAHNVLLNFFWQKKTHIQNYCEWHSNGKKTHTHSILHTSIPLQNLFIMHKLFIEKNFFETKNNMKITMSSAKKMFKYKFSSDNYCNFKSTSTLTQK